MASSVWRKALIALVGFSIGGACFWLAARHVDLSEAKQIFETADWRWIASGIILFGADMFGRVIRWRVILSHHREVEYSKVARGMLCGYAVNILLPARLGELFRADYTSRISLIDRSTLFSSIFIERLTDLVAVIIIFIMGLALSDIRDHDINRVVFVSVVILLIGILLIYLALFRATRQKTRHVLAILTSTLLPATLARRALISISSFANMLGIVPTRRFAVAICLTLPIWLFELLSVYSICRAIGLTLSAVPLMVLLGAASLSTLLPTAPGFVGSYQFAYVVVLANFGVTGALALVAATSVQIYLMLSYALLGLVVWAASPLVPASASKALHGSNI
jgi:glycosyltransferase 2 family protein